MIIVLRTAEQIGHLQSILLLVSLEEDDWLLAFGHWTFFTIYILHN
jgi:hypothetical protein